MKKLLTTISILLIVTASYAQIYTVEKVIDGNTIVVITPEGKIETVELIGINAPEATANKGLPLESQEELKAGQEAANFMSRKVIWKGEGRKVRLEFDVQERDKYGRLLAYVFIVYDKGTFLRYASDDQYDGVIERLLDDGSSESFLNADIIKWGYAQPMTIPPNVKYADLFKELYEEARENKRGLWKE